jgi:hypothetical protein
MEVRDNDWPNRAARPSRPPSPSRPSLTGMSHDEMSIAALDEGDKSH